MDFHPSMDRPVGIFQLAMVWCMVDKLSKIWGWVKTLVPSEPQNSWDLWMFIPLKMVLIGIDPHPSKISKSHYTAIKLRIWLVVWNMIFLTFPSYWEWKIIPTDELHHFSEGLGWNHQPGIYRHIYIYIYICIYIYIYAYISHQFPLKHHVLTCRNRPVFSSTMSSVGWGPSRSRLARELRTVPWGPLGMAHSSGEPLGKPWENHGKTRGKPGENHGKMVIYMEHMVHL